MAQQLHMFGDIPASLDEQDTERIGRKAKHEDYESFVNKFKPKLTTDDCMTPEPVICAIADWVANEYKLDQGNFVRPFWPGLDFTRFDYQPWHVVVDNPPFSIGAKICRWYLERNFFCLHRP